MIPELGYSFLFRDYNPSQGKWTSSDPLGYPDGWNNLAYCNNEFLLACDPLGTTVTYVWSDWQIQRIIGLNPTTASGYMYGDGIVVIWRKTVAWACSDCNKAGTKEFLETTKYVDDGEAVWAAPRASLGLSVPTATTLPALVGDVLASYLDDLIGKSPSDRAYAATCY